MSIFDTPSVGQTSEAELASLAKDNPDLTNAQPPAEQPEQADQPETETVAETQQAAEADQPEQQEGDGKPAKTVPLATLAEERKARREAEERVARLEGEFQAMQRMFQQQPQQGQPQPGQQQAQDQPPNRDEDPLGYMEWQAKRLERLEGQIQSQALIQRVQQDYFADAQRFTTQQGDFPDAYKFLLNGRAAELRAQGWQDAQIRGRLQQEEFQIALSALQQNRSPAQAAYDLAVARGYVKAAPKAQEAKPAAPDPALQEARAKAAASISEGGSPPRGEMTLDHIVNNLKGAAQEAALKKWESKNIKTSSIFRE